MGQDLLAILKNVHFLHEISDDNIERIASVAGLRDLSPGAIVFREGQKESSVYLVVKGAVALEYCTPGLGCRRLQTVGAGELLGWSPILGIEEMTATARILEPTTIVAIDAKQLVALCEHDTRFGYEFMRKTALALSQRLSATRLQLLDVYSQELPVFRDRQEV